MSRRSDARTAATSASGAPRRARTAARVSPGRAVRVRAAQALVQQKTRDGQMERGDHIEASIIDANLRELDSLRREQLLQR